MLLFCDMYVTSVNLSFFLILLLLFIITGTWMNALSIANEYQLNNIKERSKWI